MIFYVSDVAPCAVVYVDRDRCRCSVDEFAIS